MSNHDRADELVTATRDALRGVIAESEYKTTKNVAAALEMNYTSLTRNIAGENPIKLSTMYRILDLCKVTPAEFGVRVTEALNRRA